MKKGNGKIICGYSGIGKSYFCKMNKDRAIDLDSRWFEKKEGWEKMYIECAVALTHVYDYVLLTAHSSSVLLMDEIEDLKWYLVYPDITLKEEYRNRLEQREEQTQGWIDALIDFYENQITKYNTLIKNAKKIVLQKSEYLNDVIEQIV